jgi:hypothetical protein
MDLTSAFTEALTGDATPPPQTGPELVDYAGGAPQLARLDVGLPSTGALPKKANDPVRRRQYDNALRRYQRWAAPAGKERTKNPPPGKFDDLRRRLIIRRKDPLIPDSRRRGARVRIRAVVVVGTPPKMDRRERLLPSGGAGQLLDAGTVRRITDTFLDGEADNAAEDFLAAFLDAYGFDEAELENIIWIKIWPDGTPEPG